MIRMWKPWQRSTGPRTDEGKARCSRNAWKGGKRQTLRQLSRRLNFEIRKSKYIMAEARPTNDAPLIGYCSGQADENEQETSRVEI